MGATLSGAIIEPASSTTTSFYLGDAISTAVASVDGIQKRGYFPTPTVKSERVVNARTKRYETMLNSIMSFYYNTYGTTGAADKIASMCPSRKSYATSLNTMFLDSCSNATTQINAAFTLKSSRTANDAVRKCYLTAIKLSNFLNSDICVPTPVFNGTIPAALQMYNAMFKNYPLCKNGTNQSPINIRPNSTDFNTKLGGVFNNTFRMIPVANYTIHAGNVSSADFSLKWVAPERAPNRTSSFGGSSMLTKIDIRIPSEHRIDGSYFDAEVQFSNRDAKGKLYIIAVFANISMNSSPFFSQFVAQADGLKNSMTIPMTLDLSNVTSSLMMMPQWYRYQGSITSPPCTEGVDWIVGSQPIFTISANDWNAISALVGFGNSRYIQPLYRGSRGFNATNMPGRKSSFNP